MKNRILHALKSFFTSNLFKVVLFCIGLVSLEAVGRTIFRNDDTRAFLSQRGFLGQPRNSMDAVYIGSSTTYRYYEPPLGYRNHKMKVYTLTGPLFPAAAQRYWMEIIHKRQPNALIILNLNSFLTWAIPDVSVRNSLDQMPFSFSKIKYINTLINEYGYDFTDLIFPIGVFHSAWDQVKSIKINEKSPDLMGSFEKIITNTSGINNYSFGHESQNTLTGKAKKIEVLNETIETADKLGVDFLFVAVPQADEEREAALSELVDYVMSKGYTVYNMSLEGNQIALDSNKDFYNFGHTNIHGGVKTTEALCQYLLEHYPEYFPQVEDTAWQDASRRFEKILKPHILDFELDGAPQSLEIPAAQKLMANTTGTQSKIFLTWEPSIDVDGYAVFRKTNDGNWDRLDETEKCEFTDDLYVVGATNYYSVVPFRTNESGQIIYGRWQHPGAKVQMKLLAPPLRDAALQSDGTILLRWDLVDSAVSYKIFRKTDSEDEWGMINRIYSGDQFVDQDVEPGKTYIYTVQGVDGLDIDGFRDEVGLTVTVNP